MRGKDGGAPGRIRTDDPLLRRQPLYSTELQGREDSLSLSTRFSVVKEAPMPKLRLNGPYPMELRNLSGPQAEHPFNLQAIHLSQGCVLALDHGSYRTA